MDDRQLQAIQNEVMLRGRGAQIVLLQVENDRLRAIADAARAYRAAVAATKAPGHPIESWDDAATAQAALFAALDAGEGGR
jgi:hypothetical protein